MIRTLAAAALLVVALPAPASEVPGDRERPTGHPRARFPLSVYAEPGADARHGAALQQAVAGWNRVFQEAFGLAAFVWGDAEEGADVRLSWIPGEPGQLRGRTIVTVDERGGIVPPVRITLAEPRAMGETTAEQLLFQVAAHELGHALGLPHANEPGSLMCCDYASLNFEDPSVRAAYVTARRRPDVRSVLLQLTEHYRRFWAE